MDLERAISGNRQRINLPLPSDTPKVYLAIYNLDLPGIVVSKNYIMDLIFLEEGKVCESCPYGSTLEFTEDETCLCVPCPRHYYGRACSNYVPTLPVNAQDSFLLTGVSNYHYLIKNPPATIVIDYSEDTFTNSVKMYMQFVTKEGDLAGELNTQYQNGVAFAKLVDMNKQTISIETGGRDITFTFHKNSDIGPSLIRVHYIDPYQPSNAAMIIGIIGGIVGFLIAVVITYCVYKRFRAHQRYQHKNS
jgi:hypothetical protein